MNKEKRRISQRRAGFIYRAKYKEELKLKAKRKYEKNKATVLLKVKKYYEKNLIGVKEYHKDYYANKRLEVLAMVDPAMKCAMCGCDDVRFLEVNHIKGGGKKEQRGYKEENHNLGHNLILLIHRGKRGVEDLNLLCRVCNSIDHLKRVYDHTGLRVVWDKPVTITPKPSLSRLSPI